MKKFVAILLVFLLFVPKTIAFAIEIDWKSMSDQEITDIINTARLELASRSSDNQDHTIVEYQPIDTGTVLSNRELLNKGCPDFFDVKWNYKENDLIRLLDSIKLQYTKEKNDEKGYNYVYWENKDNKPIAILNGLHLTHYQCSFREKGTEEKFEQISLTFKESPYEVAQVIESRYGEQSFEGSHGEIYTLLLLDNKPEVNKLITVIVKENNGNTSVEYNYTDIIVKFFF